MKIDYHCAVAGATQTGKTTTALRLLFEQPDIKIFFNTKNDDIWNSYFHYRTNTLIGLEQIFFAMKETNNFDKKIIFNPNRKLMFKDLLKAVELVYDLHDKLRKKDKKIRMTCAIDECHNFLSARKNIPYEIKLLVAQGLSLNKFAILISQGFTDFPRGILRNCEIFIIHQVPYQDIHDMIEKGVLNEANRDEVIFSKKCNRIHNGRKCEVSHQFFFQKNVMDGLYLCQNN